MDRGARAAGARGWGLEMRRGRRVRPATPMAPSVARSRFEPWPDGVFLLGLLLLPWLPFAQTLHFSFVGFDDQLYVSDNAHVLTGLTWDNVRWAFTTFQTANWHPVTWLSLMLDATIGGSSPRIYHATNVALHSIATGLIFLGLRRSTGSVFRSAAVAALFSIHPLRAESVAWIA